MLKKLKIYPRVLIVFFVILSIIGILFVRGNEYNIVYSEYELVNFNDCFMNKKGYSIKNNEFKMLDNDPHIFFDFRNVNTEGVYAFSIELSEKIDLSKVQVYFGRDDLGFNEQDSKIFENKESNVIEIVSIESFMFLRIDINDNFEIEKLGVDDSLDVNHVKNNIYYVIAILCSAFISIILSYFSKIDKFLVVVKDSFVQAFKYLRKEKLKVLIVIALCLGELLICFLAEKMLFSNREYLNRQRIIVYYTALLVITFTYLFRKHLLEKLHLYFFGVAMLVGVAHILLAPPVVGLSWDDEIHYRKSSYISWLSNGMLPISDEELYKNYKTTIVEKNEYNRDGRDETVGRITRLDDKFGYAPVLTDIEDYDVNLQYAAYTPTALALGCARGLDLSYRHVFMIGKFMILLCYALLISISIRILSCKGKLLVTVLGLMPTSLFLATSYSYDWWVVGFCILGYSIFFSKIQKNEQFTNKQFIGLMLVMLIGLLPKAIYFPILLPMLLLKKDKYKNSKLLRGMVVITILALIATFIFPILFATATGDARGGSDVDSMRQISFILNNPMEYTKILLGFLENYLSLNSAYGYTTMMAYYGTAKHFVLCIVILTIIALIDNKPDIVGKDKNYILIKGSVLFSCFCAIVLVATALYVSFTPVGYPNINGCQLRYLIPVLFPIIYVLSDVDILVKEKTKNTYIAIAVCVLVFVFLSGIYSLCGMYY